MSDKIVIAGKTYIVMTEEELDETLIDARMDSINSMYRGLNDWWDKEEARYKVNGPE